MDVPHSSITAAIVLHPLKGVGSLPVDPAGVEVPQLDHGEGRTHVEPDSNL